MSAARPREEVTLDVDWERAGRWAGRLASPGPTGTRAELERTVRELHDAALRARPLAVRASGLEAALASAGTAALRPEVLVVDRAGWARGAAQSFGALAAPVTGGAAGVRAAPATAQAAGLLGLIAARVVGQFDPFATSAGGRLMLVAPNVLRTERAIDADPTDFRLWVCVHEQTHALQFAAAPWLAGHLRGEVAALVADLARTSAGAELAGAVSRGLRALRSGEDDDEAGVLEVMLEPEQRRRLADITAVMSLLEGHADVSMDAVGPDEIRSAEGLRTRFDARRRSANGVDRLLRRLVGLDAKLEQYRRGAAFVRGARRAGGPAALDAAWTGPAALPTARELTDPDAWVRRVHG